MGVMPDTGVVPCPNLYDRYSESSRYKYLKQNSVISVDLRLLLLFSKSSYLFHAVHVLRIVLFTTRVLHVN